MLKSKGFLNHRVRGFEKSIFIVNPHVSVIFRYDHPSLWELKTLIGLGVYFFQLCILMHTDTIINVKSSGYLNLWCCNGKLFLNVQVLCDSIPFIRCALKSLEKKNLFPVDPLLVMW